MEIEQYLYDLTESGDAIVAYTMRSASGGSLQICNLGASVLALSLPDSDGVVHDVASGYCVRGAEDIEADRNGFRERLWESRVEVNRVVMSLSYDCSGVGVMAEVVFDFDDENTFEVTYQAYTEGGELPFELSHVMEFEGAKCTIKGANRGQNIYDVADAKRNILSKVAELDCEKLASPIEVLSSLPSLYYNSESSAILPTREPKETLKEGERYIQKSLYSLNLK